MSCPPDSGDETALPTVTGVAPAVALDDGQPPDDATPVTALEPHVARRPTAEPLVLAGRIDRFVILDKLGEGGMGAVYAAYDTLLDRKVAMKVVRPDRRGSMGGVSPRERLLREAQAMARLSHPNVVAVLEVGELGEDVYLALELVEGSTLKAWSRAARRSWRETVAVFVAAGRGLAAAHAAGLVHRDFKPDNVLIGSDGRILVADFGVVSMSHGQRDGSTPSGSEHEQEAGDAFTFTGLRVGTPAYMAPEQYGGESVDARADQFSFCVALWEALYGERPFAPLARGAAFRDRPLRSLPDRVDVPAWVAPLLRRGLAVEPGARWPSLESLIEELARDRRQARRRAAVIAGTAAMIAFSVTLAFAGWTRDRGAGPSLCQDEGRHLAGVWDPERAAALSTGFVATGAPGAAAAAARVSTNLDDWSRGWVEMRTAACAATRLHGDQSEGLLDLRMRCLDRRLDRVAALVTALATVDRDGLGRAIEIGSDLPALDACSDHDQLTATAALPEDPDVRGRVEAIERDLARVAAIERTGRYPEALALIGAVVTAAAATGYAPLRAEALAVRGRLEAQTGAAAVAVATLGEASTLAAGVHADDVAADALLELVWVLADQGRGGDALALSTGAAVAVARVHDPRREAQLAAHVAGAHSVSGALVAAAAEFDRALHLAETAYGARHVQVAQILNRLGNVEDQRGRPAEARAYYERALAIAEAELGPEHPSVAVTRANICYHDSTAGHADEARRCQQRVVAALEAALGAAHPQVAWALNDLGLIDQTRGDLAAAGVLYQRALVIWEQTSGPEHPDLAWPLVNLGGLALKRRDHAGARVLCSRALRIVEAASGAAHPDALHPLACLGNALADRDPAAARPLLERALALGERAGDDAAIGDVRYGLARAALAAHARRAAVGHARAARAAYVAAGSAATAELADVSAWIKRQRL